VLSLFTDHSGGGSFKIAQQIQAMFPGVGPSRSRTQLPPSAPEGVCHFLNISCALMALESWRRGPNLAVVAVHHLPKNNEAFYYQGLDKLQNNWPITVHTIDRFCQRQLAQEGFYSVWTPQPLAVPRLSAMRCPSEFTVGTLVSGDGGGHKRRNFVERIVKDLGLQYRTHNSEEDGFLSDEQIHDWYNDITVLVVGSLFEGGPIPAKEALMAGRRVIAPPVGDMASWKDALLYSGSEASLRRALEMLAQQSTFETAVAQRSRQRQFDLNEEAKSTLGLLYGGMKE
jgi:glycosyltransferase involved in cell wall biosynthesis